MVVRRGNEIAAMPRMMSRTPRMMNHVLFSAMAAWNSWAELPFWFPHLATYATDYQLHHEASNDFVDGKYPASNGLCVNRLDMLPVVAVLGIARTGFGLDTLITPPRLISLGVS